MRFGNWRGVTLALGCASAFLLALTLFSTPAHAQFHSIPRTVEAIDLNTGGPYYAPPIPYGHYAKDPGSHAAGIFHGLLGKAHGLGMGHGAGCGACGGKGCDACGGGHGHGFGHGHGHGDGGCDTCGTGGGLFGKHKGLGLGGCGLCGGKGCGTCLGHASTVVASAQGVPTPQAPIVIPSAQTVCGDPGCGLLGKHMHKGCGLCGGSGLFKGKGCHGCASADPCGSCGGKGCGMCGKGCGACGGKGCGMCGLGGAKGKVHGAINHLLGRDKIKWFVGPGGPVPLTPGYTPYINVTRSPRDFFAFPPFTQ